MTTAPAVKATKTLLRPIARRIVRLTNAIAPWLLRFRLSRRLLNFAYERAGPVGAGFITYFVAGAQPRSDFVWTTRFGDKTLALPVRTDLERSWTNAVFWRWPPALPMRAFYEWYIDDRSTRSAARDRPVLLDIGANDGMDTIPFAAHGWTCVSFEPQAACIRYIDAVCHANGFDRVTPMQCVVTAEESETVDFFVSDSSWYSSLSRDHVEKFEPAHVVAVAAVTVDGFLKDRDLAPTCVKIDVEGAEAAVLDGARGTIERRRPDLILEVLNDRAVKQHIWDLLEPLGYRFFVMRDTRRWPLAPVANFDEFLAAQREHDHGDFVMIADDDMATRAMAGLVAPGTRSG
jgi:FkbM family methyltransferase